jgi:photosynthetic reaction center cytochrome c subunit
MGKGALLNTIKRRSLPIGSKMIMLCFAIATAAMGQTAGAKPQLAEDVYKDIRLLKGMPVDQFLDTMGFFSASTNFNCIDCHGTAAGGDWSRYADDTPKKTIARRMIAMVQELNRANFGGRRIVTCYTCHRGDMNPQGTPSLAVQNSAPISDPNEFEVDRATQGAPSPDEVFGKYLQAVGGAQALAKLTSLVLHGEYEGFDTDFEKRAVEIFAKAPDRRAVVIHYRGGDSFTTYDGREGWIAEADKPVPLIQLTAGGLEGARVDAVAVFAAGLRQLRNEWKIGYTAIGDQDVVVAEGSGDGKSPLKLYFDKNSGLLVRLVRYSQLAVGRVPAQFDFDDYRGVPGTGVKLPYRLVATWVDGRSTTKVTSIDVNPAIPDSRFVKPSSPDKAGAR